MPAIPWRSTQPLRIGALALASAGTLGACSDPAIADSATPLMPSGEFLTETRGLVTVHTRPNDPEVCPEHLEEVEWGLSTFWDFLDVPQAERGPVEWYRLSASDDLRAEGVCVNPDASACVSGTVAFGPRKTIEHELVHLALARVGRAPNLFSEGIALALTCDPIAPLPASSGRWRAGLEETLSYHQQRLVTYLLTRYPKARFVDFYRSLERSSDAAAVATGFEAVYGVSLDAVWDDALAEPFGQGCLALLSCAKDLRREPETCPSLFVGGGLPADELVRVHLDHDFALLQQCDGMGLAYPPPTFEGGRFVKAGAGFAVEVPHRDEPHRVHYTPASVDSPMGCASARLDLAEVGPLHRIVFAPPVEESVVQVVSEPAAIVHASVGAFFSRSAEDVEIQRCSDCDGADPSAPTGCSPTSTTEPASSTLFRLVPSVDPLPRALLLEITKAE